MTIIRIGLDTSKHVFQIHGVDENEKAVLRRQIRRSEVAKFFAKLAPARIGIEACGASHHWARVLRGLGHEVLLMPPQYVKPYVQRGKNDAIDAAAICEAMSRPVLGLDPGMRFVPVKTAERQAALMMLKVRDLLVKQRTMLINALRGHAAEFGVTAPKGPQQVAELLRRVASEESVPALAREMLGMLAGQLEVLNAKLKAIEVRLMAWHREDQTSQCLATIPGIGPIGGVSFALKSLPPRRRGCRTRRPFARAGTLRRGSASRRARIPLRANTGLARSAERATRACDGCWCSGQPRSSSRLSPAAPRRGSWDCWRASRRSSRRWRWPTKPAPAQAGDGPHHLGHDGERRDLPTSEGGLSPPTRDTWHWQGQRQQDGDRSIRGSGQPGESIGAQTSRSCLGPDPRNPSGPAVSPTAPQKPALAKAGGRTYDRNRPDRPSCQHLASRGPST